MPKNKPPKIINTSDGLTARQLREKIPRLTTGNFTHWVRFKAGCFPIGKTIIGTGAADLFPFDTVERVLRVMGEEKL
jgi:hypothetical protein